MANRGTVARMNPFRRKPKLTRITIDQPFLLSYGGRDIEMIFHTITWEPDWHRQERPYITATATSVPE